MTNSPTISTALPPEQLARRAKCFHPTGPFIEFKKEEIEQSILERFERIVRMYPDRIAVKAKNQTLTYQELNRSANRIANAILAERGNSAEPLGLLFKGRVAMIAAILGTLKAGKFYVPLDSSYPKKKNAFVMKDSGAAVIVTDAQSFHSAIDTCGKGYQLIVTDNIDLNGSDENPRMSIAPNTFAYVLYTSGSTGSFKG